MKVPQSISEKEFYEPAIDGLRGVAILLVILNHSMKCAQQNSAQGFLDPLLVQLGEGGSGGVSLFFILSALTLMISTSVRFSQEKSPKTAFYLRRSFRILPLWWLFILISVIVRKPASGEILPHVFMYFGFLPRMNFTHVGWSLFVEESFYLFFPFIFSLILRLPGALLFFFVTLLFSKRIIFLTDFNLFLQSFGFLSRIPLYHYVTFGLGIICYHITKSNELRFQAWAKTLPKLFWDCIVFLSFLAALLFQAHSNFQIFACFVLVIASMPTGTLIRSLLSNKLLRTFGVCCYSIYLFHGLFLFSIRYTDWFRSLGTKPLNSSIQMLMAFALAVCASFLFGVISFRWLERSCVHAGKRVIQKFDFGKH
ncbi:MAG: acyltransferase family protein [Bdellovibrio sp.]